MLCYSSFAPFTFISCASTLCYLARFVLAAMSHSSLWRYIVLPTVGVFQLTTMCSTSLESV